LQIVAIPLINLTFSSFPPPRLVRKPKGW
jgi:hypothetical protein